MAQPLSGADSGETPAQDDDAPESLPALSSPVRHLRQARVGTATPRASSHEDDRVPFRPAFSDR
jgi:hypothetical protein